MYLNTFIGMGAEKFNYHKVLFTVGILKNPEERITYLYKVKMDINRIIQCFYWLIQ